MEKTRLDIKHFSKKKEEYFPFLLAAMIILLVELLASAFILGIRLAGPVLIALFMTGTALAVLSKTMPQLNILTVGFAVRLAVALLVAGLSITACEEILVDGVWDAVDSIRAAFGLDPDHTMLVN